jgi:hypothetical protein
MSDPLKYHVVFLTSNGEEGEVVRLSIESAATKEDFQKILHKILSEFGDKAQLFAFEGVNLPLSEPQRITGLKLTVDYGNNEKKDVVVGWFQKENKMNLERRKKKWKVKRASVTLKLKISYLEDEDLEAAEEALNDCLAGVQTDEDGHQDSFVFGVRGITHAYEVEEIWPKRINLKWVFNSKSTGKPFRKELADETQNESSKGRSFTWAHSGTFNA